VNLAVQVQKALLLDGIYADVVSVPSFADFVKQNENYKNRVVPSENLKVVIEAGSSFGWEKIAGNNALFFCIDRFGLSAPAEKIYAELGLSVESIVSAIKQQINLD
jgi:transketolase